LPSPSLAFSRGGEKIKLVWLKAVCQQEYSDLQEMKLCGHKEIASKFFYVESYTELSVKPRKYFDMEQSLFLCNLSSLPFVQFHSACITLRTILNSGVGAIKNKRKNY
jgi:hypothetical protein